MTTAVLNDLTLSSEIQNLKARTERHTNYFGSLTSRLQEVRSHQANLSQQLAEFQLLPKSIQEQSVLIHELLEQSRDMKKAVKEVAQESAQELYEHQRALRQYKAWLLLVTVTTLTTLCLSATVAAFGLLHP